MDRFHQIILSTLILVTILIVTACGGGDSAPTPNTLSGVAAEDDPIAGGTITVMCADGASLSTLTNATGAWTANISGYTLPCAVEVSGGTVNSVTNTVAYYSIATKVGTVNVNPLTDLMLANVAGTFTPGLWFAGLTPSTLTSITSDAINTALINQCAALSGLTPLCTNNPVTTVFATSNGNTMYNMLVALQMAMFNTGVSYNSLLGNAADAGYSDPATGFNTALNNSYIVTIGTVSAIANTTAQSLTVGTAMTSFSPLTASGGTPPYTYSYAGTLPSGLSFDGSNGVVTGIPDTVYVTDNVVFSVEDTNQNIANTTSAVSFTVGPASIMISAIATTAAQNLTVGTPMDSFSPLLPSGGAVPYTYSYTGTLPEGLNFDVSTGSVTGTPTAYYVTANLVFSVKDADDVAASTTSTVSFKVSSWSTTGTMVADRVNHTATLLPDGKVLVTGGSSGVYFSSAELYDPITGLFTATGSMAAKRSLHSAILLQNEKVLITGGIAELYDPATGQFTTTGSMATGSTFVGGRSYTATLLSNGKVLIVGGVDAELYDPETGLFTATGSMVTITVFPRSAHTATLLSSGKVLVTGGPFLSSAELYDPVTGLFTATGSMTRARHSHTASLLSDGKVLITGGLGALSSAELYDPATGEFTATGSMVTAVGRWAHTATLLSNGKVLIAGGVESGSSGIARAEVYDPATGLFTATDSMATGRALFTATRLDNGKVIVIGGTSFAAELYQ